MLNVQVFPWESYAHFLLIDIDDVILLTEKIRKPLKEYSGWAAKFLQKRPDISVDSLPHIRTEEGFYSAVNNYSVSTLEGAGVNPIVVDLFREYNVLMRRQDMEPIQGALDLIERCEASEVPYVFFSKGDPIKQREKLTTLGIRVDEGQLHATGAYAGLQRTDNGVVLTHPNKGFVLSQILQTYGPHLTPQNDQSTVMVLDDQPITVNASLEAGVQVAQVAIPNQTPNRGYVQGVPVVWSLEQVQVVNRYAH